MAPTLMHTPLWAWRIPSSLAAGVHTPGVCAQGVCNPAVCNPDVCAQGVCALQCVYSQA